MSATINWTIDWMSASTQTINGFSEVVLTCGWRCTGTEANTANPPVTFTSSVYGTCSFPEPATGSPFTPFAQLTQNQVLEWIWASGVDQTATQTALDTMIANQINPPTINPPLPWSN